ncbi:DUF3594 hypothetical protein [Helicosporidium sp. ATCC 50920]|nr:DUF3594 hypothetical protein [Helicosporidium sp. ATCC 50920]|eukprot:KDD76620.1 DUF3594 hypothetical protein [Helicosporidium sp. ATCC 50920]
MESAPFPKSIDDIYRDYVGRREGLLKALIDDAGEFYDRCDPEQPNLCLFGASGHPDGSWTVSLPAAQVPPELPDPVLGINFARKGMDRKDWLSLCAVHSDAWLMSLIFFFGARYDDSGRAELFSLVNQHPTVFEIATGRASRSKINKRKQPVYAKQYAGAALAAAHKAGAAVGGGAGPGAAPHGIRHGMQPSLASSRDRPTSRMLSRADLHNLLLWPDDGKWYLVQVLNTDLRYMKVKYSTGEDEELDLEETIANGHMSLLEE